MDNDDKENPYVANAGEIAKFAGFVGVVLMLWIAVAILAPEASRIMTEWLK